MLAGTWRASARPSTMSGTPLEPTPFRLERHHTPGGARVVSVSGEIDIATAPQVDEALARREPGETAVVLDLRGTTFLDSSGIRVLVAAHRAGVADGIPFSVAGSPPVLDLLETTGVSGHIAVVGGPPA